MFRFKGREESMGRIVVEFLVLFFFKSVRETKVVIVLQER